MYITETALLLLLASLLVLQAVPQLPRIVLRCVSGCCLLTLLLAFALGQARWQLLPAWIVLFWIGRGAWRQQAPTLRPRSGKLVTAAGGLLLSAILASGMAIITLPAPAGPWPVGTTVFTLTDTNRTDTAFGSSGARQLTLQLWYPATTTDAPLRPLWADLHRGPTDPVMLFTRYLRRIPSHSQQDAPLATAEAPWPLLVYSHGLTLFPEQNTLLMEHLASLGYLVAAVGHTRMGTRMLLSEDAAVLVDFPRLQAAMAQSSAASTPELATRARNAGSRLQRAEIALESIEASQALNALMVTWVEDLEFVLDSLTAGLAAPAALLPFVQAIDVARIGLLGMSFGGGAITELCKRDRRCKAGVNLDGGIFGSLQRVPLQVPYLALASPANAQYFEYQLLVSAAPHQLAVIRDTTHADFMDLTLLLPLLHWTGLAGPRDAEQTLALVNRLTGQFFDTWLRGHSTPLDATAYAGVDIETRNLPAVQPR